MKKSEVLQKLGDLLFRCQRIEWLLKYMVDKACIKFEFDNPKDFKNDCLTIGEKWQDDLGTLGNLKNRYLEMLYGASREVSDSPTKIRIQIDVNFDPKNRSTRESQLTKLVEERNYLSHRFGLDFDLANEGNLKKAVSRLGISEKIVKDAENGLRSDKTLFETIMKRMGTALNGMNAVEQVVKKNHAAFDADSALALLQNSKANLPRSKGKLVKTFINWSASQNIGESEANKIIDELKKKGNLKVLQNDHVEYKL